MFGGAFETVNGSSRLNIARVNGSTGAISDPFNPQANLSVEALALQTDGKVLIGGNFTRLGPDFGPFFNRNHIARLDAITGTPDSFNPDANAAVNSIVVQPNGSILVGGDFTIIGAVDRTDRRNHIARLSSATGLADSFNPNANGNVTAIALQNDGGILVGGEFTAVAGQTRNRIARLGAFGTLDTAFNPNANGLVSSILVQADGRIVVAGEFTNIGGQARNRIARLDPITGAADLFDPNANLTVSALALQDDGKILAGGLFNGIGGKMRRSFARLSNDIAALATLLVSRTTVTFLPGGSSPQVTRVLFENSADGVNYNFLGYGTLSNGSWTLTGLNLSLGQNIYLRARGTYHSGRQNGSESLVESVRYVFLVDLPLGITSIKRLGGGEIFLEGTGSSDTGYTIRRSLTDPAAASFSNLGTVRAKSSGIWDFTDTSAPELPHAFYRATFP